MEWYSVVRYRVEGVSTGVRPKRSESEETKLSSACAPVHLSVLSRENKNKKQVLEDLAEALVLHKCVRFFKQGN